MANCLSSIHRATYLHRTLIFILAQLLLERVIAPSLASQLCQLSMRSSRLSPRRFKVCYKRILDRRSKMRHDDHYTMQRSQQTVHVAVTKDELSQSSEQEVRRRLLIAVMKSIPTRRHSLVHRRNRQRLHRALKLSHISPISRL